ncbi:MAG: histidine kinase dimerization/phospho-acceptor domain-containing protein, partial [Chloroflexia bacterium]
MNRLWVRLMLAFALVILVAVGVVALLAGLSVRQEFHRYLRYSGIWPSQALVDQLVEFYRGRGSWEGVERILVREALLPTPRINARRNWGTGPLQFVLADADGRVVFDGGPPPRERYLTREERAAGRSIVVDGQTVGWLVIVPPGRPALLEPLELIFIGRLSRWLILGALLAGALGLILGAILSRGLTAPLRRLAEAAQAVARRDFTQQVREEGSEEVAEVARAFNRMTAALAEAERLRQNMVADVAHELRTPLSVLQGNLQAILDDVYPLDKAEIVRLFEETRLLSRLVDDLRDLALADAGQLRLNVGPVAAAPIVRAT